MRHVERNSAGKIVATFACEQFPGQELLEDAHPDIVEFSRPPAPTVAKRPAIMRALDKAGLLEACRAAVAQAGPLVQELWLSPEFHIDDLTLIEMATQMGIVEQLPALFAEANGNR
jgi:hypothetical protein